MIRFVGHWYPLFWISGGSSMVDLSPAHLLLHATIPKHQLLVRTQYLHCQFVKSGIHPEMYCSLRGLNVTGRNIVKH